MSTDHVKLGYLYAEIVSSHDVSRFDVGADRTARPHPERNRTACRGGRHLMFGTGKEVVDAP